VLLHYQFAPVVLGMRSAVSVAMKAMEITECRMLTLAMWDEIHPDCLHTFAAGIRQLPEVLRVRVDWDAHELEILHQSTSTKLMKESISRCCWHIIRAHIKSN